MLRDAFRLLLTAASALAVAHAAHAETAAPAQDYRARTHEQEVVYFLLLDRFENGDMKNDTGGLKGGRLATGFDPTAKGFYHGGDLKGLVQRLDYIQGLGATAVWLAPIFKNKPVQGPAGDESAGYHGYWITDFTRVDPHFGTNADFKAFVDAAHARGMKVYMDIVVNHTADVIQYKETSGAAPYRSKAEYPFSRRGGATGQPINAGFVGDADASKGNWEKLTDPSFAYTPVVKQGEENIKVPTWLNDPRFYHNRGNSNWFGESSQYGDFSGLDDIATEDPRVVVGFTDVFGSWIDRFGLDGFRIDTAKHVNPEFWRRFVPAMLSRAKAKGVPNFHIFGEVAVSEYDPALLASWTRDAALPSVLDFGFNYAVLSALAGKGNALLSRLMEDDALYEGGPLNKGGKAAALRLPTFLSNHDQGRMPFMVRSLNPKLTDDDLLKRQMLGHALMFGLRGVPVIYSGDEQGMVGRGGDQLSRQDMFPSKVELYNTETLLGTKATTAESNFDTTHPLYRLIARLSDLRRRNPALQSGATRLRVTSDKPGLFAASRFDPVTHREVLLAFNTSDQPVDGAVETEAASRRFTALEGSCPATAAAPGTTRVSLPPLGFAICAAEPD